MRLCADGRVFRAWWIKDGVVYCYYAVWISEYAYITFTTREAPLQVLDLDVNIITFSGMLRVYYNDMRSFDTFKDTLKVKSWYTPAVVEVDKRLIPNNVFFVYDNEKWKYGLLDLRERKFVKGVNDKGCDERITNFLYVVRREMRELEEAFDEIPKLLAKL